MARRHEQQLKDGAAEGPERPAPMGVTEEISELLAGYSIHALAPEDTEFLERYLAVRPEWQTELAGYEHVSNLLSYASPPQQVPVRARAAILARVDALAIESHEEARARAHPRQQLRIRWKRWRGNVPRLAWAAAVPSTIIAIIFIMASIVMQARLSDQQAELAAFQQEQSKATDVLLAENSGRRVIELIQSSAAPLARGRLFIDQHANTAMLVVRDMPSPGDGNVYMVWVLTGAMLNQYQAIGTLDIDEFGRGQKILDPSNGFNNNLLVRITIEPADDQGIPSGPDVMTGGI